MSERKIRKVAVLGSGVMGSRLACHFANVGLQVLLLDIAPKELNDDEKKKGLTLDNPKVKNRIVDSALASTLKSNPSPIYKKEFVSRITTGNFDTNMKDIADCDWILEAVVENINIKKSVFDNVEKFRKPGTLITSNTSGIPIHLMTEGRSDDFQQNFCGTHFFNPPRYLELLEVIPGPKTKKDVIDFFMHYGDLYLGKTTVLCKDTPAFIANRVGVYSIMAIFHIMAKMELTISGVDSLTGVAIGHPKSATFRTADVVGIDTLIKVANGVKDSCPNDEQKEIFSIPDYVNQLAKNNFLGDKTGQGFYKKVKNKEGKSEIQAIDPKTLEYSLPKKTKFASVEQGKQIDSLRDRLKLFIQVKDKAGDFYRSLFYGLFAYSSNRIPEITDTIYALDDALRAGFGWEIGPFATWDILGVEETIKQMEATGNKPAAWIYDMVKAGNKTFFKVENGTKKYYDQNSKSYLPIPGAENFIILENYSNNVVWKNVGTDVKDIGDGILCLEFHSKMNTIGSEVLEGFHKSVDIAEKDFRGLVIGNNGANFSAGANLALILMFAAEQEYDELDMAIRQFQKMTMRVRYSSVPVVVSPHALTLGGGCEMTLHADKVVASAESYIGLVEFAVGLIPGGGGTKEMTLRASDSYAKDEIEFPELQKRFLNIAMAKVSTSADEAMDMDILKKGRDEIVVNHNRVIAEAKRAAIDLAEAGYTKPIERTDITVLGKTALGPILTGSNAMWTGKYISEQDKLISQKLGYIMCGGDLSQPTKVSEQYLLDLEREAFLSLCGTRKTLERIQAMLTTGKALRN